MNQLKKSNYDKFPAIAVDGHICIEGWKNIVAELKEACEKLRKKKVIIAIEYYPGVYQREIEEKFLQQIPGAKLFDASTTMKTKDEIEKMVYPYVTDDPVFGFITPLNLIDFFSEKKIALLREQLNAVNEGICIIYNLGASFISPKSDLLLYADMPRWEIQLRFRNKSIGNICAQNAGAEFSYLYKRSFFVDWRVCDRHKQRIMNDWDYVLDTTIPDHPKLISGSAFKDALKETVSRPFRVVPFFDPGPWGGQWLKEVCDLDRKQQNFAWGFDCVPEENSLLFSFNNVLFETPAINLVFAAPEKLLGQKVYKAFGTEFPIRFDFLDTMDGGNLSLQVHPLKKYIREKFGMAYTQDESYYFLDAKEEAFVYLGLKEKIVPEEMINDLEKAQEKGGDFDAEEYVEKWPVKKHDHVLIPAGTVHCSGADTVVLEISATPYIFTFKLWDWGRMGLDGKPRPISIGHGKKVIQWNRTASWTKANLINHIEKIAEGEGWLEEKTGLDETSFIETRRHWFTRKVTHHTNGNFNVLNLIKGREAIVESPGNLFKPFVIHYAETFIIPAAVAEYSIRPYGESEGLECATIKAYVRTQNLIDYRINKNMTNEINKRYVYKATIVAAVGGLLFGYDTAVVAGAIGFIQKKYDLSPQMVGWVASCALIGCIAGAMFAGKLSDRVGRKKVLILSAILFAVSSIGIAIPMSLNWFVFFRLIGGLGIGIASTLAPMYISEIAPAKIRGQLVSINQLGIVSGILLIYFVNYTIAGWHDEAWNISTGWRWMFGSGIIPSVIFLILLFFVPESPRWLAQKERWNEAENILSKINGTEKAKTELKEIRATLNIEKTSFRDLLKPGIRKALLIGIILCIFSQVTGINAIMYYAPEIFKSTGDASASALMQTVLVGIINLLFTLVAIKYVDKWGRRTLLLLGAGGMAVCLAIVGSAFYFGFAQGYLVLIAILAYISFFAISLGPLAFVVIAEIFSNRNRGMAMSVCIFFLWVSVYVVSQTFPMLLASIGSAFTFWIYMIMSICAFVFVLKLIPETKEKSLEEIELYWLPEKILNN